MSLSNVKSFVLTPFFSFLGTDHRISRRVYASTRKWLVSGLLLRSLVYLSNGILPFFLNLLIIHCLSSHCVQLLVCFPRWIASATTRPTVSVESFLGLALMLLLFLGLAISLLVDLFMLFQQGNSCLGHYWRHDFHDLLRLLFFLSSMIVDREMVAHEIAHNGIHFVFNLFFSLSCDMLLLGGLCLPRRVTVITSRAAFSAPFTTVCRSITSSTRFIPRLLVWWTCTYISIWDSIWI